MKGIRNFSVATIMLLTGSTMVHAQFELLKFRSVKVINKGWKFQKEDLVGAQAVAYAGENVMSTINLPHSFEMPYWRANSANRPYIGWYRKHIRMDSATLQSKRVNIEFEAAFLEATVYVNGDTVGIHQGGYTGFTFDITGKLHAGDNVIAVRLNASMNPQIAPRAGEHIFAGGIYRDVYLVITNPLHVDWYGTFVTTPGATAVSATVKVKTDVTNDATVDKTCKVVSIVLDSTGREVTRIESTQAIAAGSTFTFAQTCPAIVNPHLWTPDTNTKTPPSTPLDLKQRPYLYKVYTEIYDSTVMVDDYVTPLGIRTIDWNTTHGFVLNGKKLWLKGVNVHQDHAGWGDATCNSGSYRDVLMAKNAGFNFIRGSHYPHDPAFADACDQIGICLWVELPLWGIGAYRSEQTSNWDPSAYPPNASDQPNFDANVMAQLAEMIKINRNHPSVIIWSMGNEFGYSNNNLGDQVLNLLKRQVDYVHAMDSTRPTGQGIGFGLGPPMNILVQKTDVAGLNGGNHIAEYTINNKTSVSMCSEYGSGVLIRGGSGDIFDGCFDINIAKSIGTIRQMDKGVPVQFLWRAGITFWCLYDHGSNRGMGLMGMVDHARIPKRRYYYYRSIYAGIPEPPRPIQGTAYNLVLTADTTIITDDGRSDVYLLCQVQNRNGRWVKKTPEITFTSNIGIFPSSSTGSQTITFKSGAVENGVAEGMCAIEFRSYQIGMATITATSPGLLSSTVTIMVKPGIDNGVVTSFLPEEAGTGIVNICKTVTATLKVFGNSFVVPLSMKGKKVSATIYNLQGRVVADEVIDKKDGIRMIQYGVNKQAKGIYIIKLTTIQ